MPFSAPIQVHVIVDARLQRALNRTIGGRVEGTLPSATSSASATSVLWLIRRYSTFTLMHWGRDRPTGRLPLPELVHGLCRATALTMGLNDRGLLAPGYKADINVIDFERLHLHPPEVSYDLPSGARRLVQRAEGYVATVLSGRTVYRDGKHSGELPGRLVRGERG